MSRLNPVLFAVGIVLLAGSASAQVTVLNHATVIDGTGRPTIQNAAIVIDAGEIKDIGPANSVAIPRGAEVVDLTGKTIMPGIINLHGHVGMVKGLDNNIKNFTRENIGDQLRTYASYGVTATTSLDADLGISINVSTSVEGAKQVAASCRIKRHSVEYSLGFSDPHDHLPNSQVLELATMCGHGMVSFNFARKMLDRLREDRRTPEQVATTLARFCPCGVYNPERAKRLLEDARTHQS